jgi:hypothetical protein
LSLDNPLRRPVTRSSLKASSYLLLIYSPRQPRRTVIRNSLKASLCSPLGVSLRRHLDPSRRLIIEDALREEEVEDGLGPGLVQNISYTAALGNKFQPL